MQGAIHALRITGTGACHTAYWYAYYENTAMSAVFYWSCGWVCTEAAAATDRSSMPATAPTVAVVAILHVVLLLSLLCAGETLRHERRRKYRYSSP